MTRESIGKVGVYIGGATLTIIVIVIGWIFGAGQQMTNIKSIPEIESRLKVVENCQSGQTVELRYIRQGVERIERKLDK